MRGRCKCLHIVPPSAMGQQGGMKEYRPKSEFLMMLVNDEISLTGSALAEANLARLIELTVDVDDSNRDWATMLLVHSQIDTPAVRAALRRAADDPHVDTRCEALVGLAVLEPAFALPRVRAMLEAEEIYRMTVEAAALLGDPSLVPMLEAWAEALADDDDQWFLSALTDALQACRAGAR